MVDSHKAMDAANGTNSQPGFPIVRTLISLTMLAALIWFAGLLIFQRFLPQTDLACVHLAVALVWLSSIVSLAPVTLVGPFGLMPTVWACFIGMALRMTLCAGAALLVALKPVIPSGPFAGMLVAAYLPMLAVEAAALARYLWSKDSLPRPHAGQATLEVGS